MTAIWKTVGPIVLLQILVAFLYIAWPWMRRVLAASGKLIESLLPDSPEVGPSMPPNEEAFRRKWREAEPERERPDRQERTIADETPPRQPSGPRENYLRTLGLRGSITKSEIKRAYRKLAKRYHPDQFAAHHHSTSDRECAAEKMVALNEAYDWLLANPL